MSKIIFVSLLFIAGCATVNPSSSPRQPATLFQDEPKSQFIIARFQDLENAINSSKSNSCEITAKFLNPEEFLITVTSQDKKKSNFHLSPFETSDFQRRFHMNAHPGGDHNPSETIQLVQFAYRFGPRPPSTDGISPLNVEITLVHNIAGTINSFKLKAYYAGWAGMGSTVAAINCP
jgi:hypothetical protein